MSTSDDLIYTSSTGTVIKFDDVRAIRLGEGDVLRSHKWARNLGFRGYTGLARQAQEISIEVVVNDLDYADEMRKVFDYDTAVNKPGKLSLGGWSQHALVVESANDLWRPSTVAFTLTIGLLDGIWRKEKTVHIPPSGGFAGNGIGKGYPHGYPYGYSVQAPSQTIKLDGYLPSSIKLTVFGAVSAPSITIGGNVYKYGGDVPAGGYLVIDGATKTALVINENGDAKNALPELEIGLGEGCGTYAFEKLKPGTSRVDWNGSFGFDLTTYLEDCEVPWTL
ncbi:MAG: hypothetical protein KHZ79_06255 [Atopobium minutum]|uniref:Phage tail protein n=1 Tax=Atopobium minutum TaxID=1381 RepID=A0AB38A4U7_9ACTN|nr:hypothetical protein [Atopobium minutum]KRN55038.1 hypothetical protein IV72_GL000534 [Atopobium minutum]MBS4873957.1 hypothetical protein [Atopobium minutum]SEB43458.1 hypothetical protein SAMN04489746_0209 [Atopobium minutum]